MAQAAFKTLAGQQRFASVNLFFSSLYHETKPGYDSYDLVVSETLNTKTDVYFFFVNLVQVKKCITEKGKQSD